MAIWNRNHRSCTTTWTTLRILDQNNKVFKDSGAVKMSELTYWNQTASAEMRKLQTATLINQIDNIFRLVFRAQYEQGVTKEKALSDMSDVFTSATKTIADLAEIADTSYLFWREEKDD